MTNQHSEVPMQIASIIVGTNDGSSTVFAQPKRFIHQHAMRVSRQRSDKALPSSDADRGDPQSRDKLMTRFRLGAASSEGRRAKRKAKPKSRSKPGDTLPQITTAKQVPCQQQITLVLHKPIGSNLFPSEPGLDAGFISQLLEHSLYGQAAFVTKPGEEIFPGAYHDNALLDGISALACLGRALDQQETPRPLSLELKGRTIRAVRERINANPENMSVGTVGAIASLAAFDMLECLGNGEPRADHMTFLHMAVSAKGGLRSLAKDTVSTSGQSTVLQSIILWLDLSYAILEETPSQFAYFEAPLHLASAALHAVSMHMTPLNIVFAELSDLSRAVDIADPDTPDVLPQHQRPGTRVHQVEQYITTLGAQGTPSNVLEILRLTTFLYSARYIRRFTSNSRLQMQLAIRLQKCLEAYFGMNQQHHTWSEVGARFKESDTSTAYQAMILWSATVAAASSCSFREIWGHDHEGRRSSWTKLISHMLQIFDIHSIVQVEEIVHGLTHDTAACRRDRRVLLQACGVSA